MTRIPAGLLGIVVLLAGQSLSAQAQKSTELFIPVGLSPGISNTISLIGMIDTFNEKTRTIEFVSASGSRTATVADRTLIWIDRSKVSLPNHVGSLSDLRKGRLVEIKYADNEPRGRGVAEWIKVQLPTEQ